MRSTSALPQVLFNEQQSQYVKLDVVTRGLRPQKLQCIEGYGTTPSAGPHPFHFLKPCQVSGLLRLDKGTELQTITGSSFKLHAVGNPSASPHIFSIFKVNWNLESHSFFFFCMDGIFFPQLGKTVISSRGLSHRATAASLKKLIWKTNLTFVEVVVESFFFPSGQRCCFGTQKHRHLD